MHNTAYEPLDSEADVGTDLKAAAELLRTLGSPIRLAILSELTDTELCVHEIVDQLFDGGSAVSQPLVSQHLRVLRQRGLVRTRRRGREVAYTLADSHISHIIADAVSHVGHPVDLPDEGGHQH
jgi:DNA-binding transcriptional ArsR family regulator